MQKTRGWTSRHYGVVGVGLAVHNSLIGAVSAYVLSCEMVLEALASDARLGAQVAGAHLAVEAAKKPFVVPKATDCEAQAMIPSTRLATTIATLLRSEIPR